jgi:cytochrome c-type biogenesis protein CcmH
MKRLALVIAFFAACAALPAPARAQQPAVDEAALETQTKALASHLRCPVCQGLSIQDSPTELAREMRDVVKDQLASGKTPAQVKEYFTSKYGEWILLEPEPEGVNLAVYLLPVLGLLVGGAVIGISVRRWTRQGALLEGEPEAGEAAAEY